MIDVSYQLGSSCHAHSHLPTSLTFCSHVCIEDGGIKSTDQVVFTERVDIFRLVSQERNDNSEQDSAISIQDFEAAYEILYEQCLMAETAPAITGDKLLLLEEEKARNLHWDGTGLEGLDEVLHGFEGRGIIELTGKTGVGKTVSRKFVEET